MDCVIRKSKFQCVVQENNKADDKISRIREDRTDLFK